MVFYDLKTYAQANWTQYINPVSIVSADDNGVSLVTQGKDLYNFDSICLNDLFQGLMLPFSVDGIMFGINSIELIEFKSGIYPSIPVQQALSGSYQDKYFYLKQKHIKQHVVAKAIESYITLEKKVSSLCPENINGFKLNYTLVINSDPTNKIGAVLTNRSVINARDQKLVTGLNNTLKRLTNYCDTNKMNYYFDSVNIIPDYCYHRTTRNWST